MPIFFSFRAERKEKNKTKQNPQLGNFCKPCLVGEGVFPMRRRSERPEGRGMSVSWLCWRGGGWGVKGAEGGMVGMKGGSLDKRAGGSTATAFSF